MIKKPMPAWEDVLSAACRLQKILPDAVLVGGTSASLYAKHRCRGCPPNWGRSLSSSQIGALMTHYELDLR
jgi:hypothetical protein